MAERFGDSYDKARRAYGLGAGLLLAWEIVGIDVAPNQPITEMKIALKSPQALPWVLLALIAYYAFRLSMEWWQAAVELRQHRAAKIDFYVAHAIAIIAVGVYGVQTVLRLQLADTELPTLVSGFVMGAFLAASPMTRNSLQSGWLMAAILAVVVGLFYGYAFPWVLGPPYIRTVQLIGSGLPAWLNAIAAALGAVFTLWVVHSITTVRAAASPRPAKVEPTEHVD